MGTCLFIYLKKTGRGDWFLTIHVYIMNYTIIHTASVLLTSNSKVGSQSSKMLNNKISTSVAARNYRAYERQFRHLRWFKIRFVISILDTKRKHTFTYNEHSLFVGGRICQLSATTYALVLTPPTVLTAHVLLKHVFPACLVPSCKRAPRS